MQKKHVALAFIVVLLLMGIGWAAGFFSWEDPQVAELEQLRDENIKKIDDLSREQRRSLFESFREKVRTLSPEQREAFFKSSRPIFQKLMNDRMNQFFALEAEEQTDRLDEMIDRMEKRRSQQDNGNRAQEGRGGGWGNMSPQERDRRRQEMLDRTTPEMRAKFDRFRDMLNARREQRGLEPLSGRGFWRILR